MMSHARQPATTVGTRLQYSNYGTLPQIRGNEIGIIPVRFQDINFVRINLTCSCDARKFGLKI